MVRLLQVAREATAGSAQAVTDYSDIGRQLRLPSAAATLTNWKSRGISKQGAIDAAKLYKTTPAYLLEGASDQRHASAGELVAREPKPNETAYLPGFQALSIPVLAQAGSMGVGEDQLHNEIVVGRLTVSPEWITRTIKPTRPENLRFIHGYGDSMEPTFVDGDVLLVDTGINDPKVDGVYVLEANDRIYIKRVRQRMDGNFEISSDNPTVKTVDVLNGTHTVTVHGRVVWAWNGRKM